MSKSEVYSTDTVLIFARAKRDPRILFYLDPEAFYEACNLEASHAGVWARREKGAPEIEIFVNIPAAIAAGFKPTPFVPS